MDWTRDKAVAAEKHVHLLLLGCNSRAIALHLAESASSAAGKVEVLYTNETYPSGSIALPLIAYAASHACSSLEQHELIARDMVRDWQHVYMQHGVEEVDGVGVEKKLKSLVDRLCWSTLGELAAST